MAIKVKRTVSVGTCFMYVEGLSMNCPLCGLLVESGQRHRCGTLANEAEHQRKLRRQVAREKRKVK